MMNRAEIVSDAFDISLIVGGVVLIILLLAYGAYAYYYERKHQRYVESKTQETKLPVLPPGDYFLPKSIHDDKYDKKEDDNTEEQHASTDGVSNSMPAFDPTQTSPDLGYASKPLVPNGKHHKTEGVALDEPHYSVADTVVDMCIPREVLEFDGPITRLNLLKTTPVDTDYFEKIKEMADGIH